MDKKSAAAQGYDIGSQLTKSFVWARKTSQITAEGESWAKRRAERGAEKILGFGMWLDRVYTTHEAGERLQCMLGQGSKRMPGVGKSAKRTIGRR